MGKEDDELPVAEQDDGSAIVGTPEPVVEDNEKQDEKKDDRTSEESDDDDEEHAGRTPEEQEAIRARRRIARANKKERHNELAAQAASQAEMIRRLEQQVAILSNKSSGAELAQLDAAIGSATENVANLKKVIANAVTAKDGRMASEATERMIQENARAQELLNVKRQYTAQQSAPPPTDPRIGAMANKWFSQNPWFDVKERDMDSRIARAIDTALDMERIYQPGTQEYWDELDSRIKKYLPHVKSSTLDTAPALKPSRRPPVSGSGREAPNGAASQNGGFHLSAARVQALKDSGAYDDPVRLARMVKSYREYDRKARSN